MCFSTTAVILDERLYNVKHYFVTALAALAAAAAALAALAAAAAAAN